MHARFCNASVAKLRRREDVLVETDHYTHAMTNCRPPTQVKPGTATAREALLFMSSQRASGLNDKVNDSDADLKHSTSTSSSFKQSAKPHLHHSIASQAAKEAVEKTAMLWSTSSRQHGDPVHETRCHLKDNKTISVGDLLNEVNVASFHSRNVRDAPVLLNEMEEQRQRLSNSNANEELSLSDVNAQGVDIDF
jgi:hypothetical protein